MTRGKILYILAEIEDFQASRAPLARAMRDRGYEIHVAAPGAARDEKLKLAGYTGHDLPLAARGLTPVAAAKNILAIRRVLREVKPGIAHTVTLKYSLLSGLAAKGIPGTRHVFTIAGLGYLFSGADVKSKILRVLAAPFLKCALNRPGARVTFQNSDDMDILMRGKFVRPETATLIYGSGVDLEKFHPAGAGAGEDPPLVLMPARLVRDKGVSVFIDMAEILAKRGVRAQFMIAGGTTAHNPLALSENEMKEMIRGKPVEWPGRVADMPGLYARAALVVYPSWYREGIPRVLLEAAAAGKAAITTDHPGCRDAVTHGDNGLLVPVKDAVATADAVQSLLADPARREQMGRRGRERTEKEFDSRLIAEQTLRVYGI